MDAQRFDDLAKTLASRLSRRNALRRAGAAASASLLAASGIRPDQAAALVQAQNNGQPLYTLIRRYTLSVPTGQVRQALQQGYVANACNAPGFVAYLTVEDEEGDFATVAVFRSQSDLENFATAEANWIAQNLDDLLPAPDEAISGDTYVHGVVAQGFPNTCQAAPASPPPAAPAGAPAQSTNAPAQPTGAPAQPTSAPAGPTPTPTQPCTAQGCTCVTGTQAPCDQGLVCCPTTDLLGGPGVCQTEAVCYPNECRANGRSCPRSCGTTEACPSCCSNYCNGDGVCDNSPAPCTSENCACTPGANAACDSDLVCCTTTGTGGSICLTPSVCASALCPHQYCGCQTGVQGACDAGLVCCATTSDPGGSGICLTEAECDPSCSGQGCGCSGGVQGVCDPGFVCCQNGVVLTEGAGTCQPESACAPAPCTGEGCACTTGTLNACDLALVCCGTSGVPGGPGTCMAQSECGLPCTGSNCTCDPSNANACDQGLTCCAVGSGYICLGSAQCGPCTQVGCPCTAGTEGACNVALVCCSGGGPGSVGTCLTDGDCQAQFSCTGQGCACTGGVQGACDAGLICCVQGDPGAPGTCQTEDACPGSLCTGEGCDCAMSDPSACQEGLVCCGPGGVGAMGTCQTSANCTGPCTPDGGACDASCAWENSCGPCCSGYCNGSGSCDSPPQTTCIADGQACDGSCNWGDSCAACCSGFCDGGGACNEPGASTEPETSSSACGDQGCTCDLSNPGCVDGLVCCDDGTGVTGTCATGC